MPLETKPACAPPHRTILSQGLLSQLGEFPLIFGVPGSFQQSHWAIKMSKDQTGSRLKMVEVAMILRRLYPATPVHSGYGQ